MQEHTPKEFLFAQHVLHGMVDNSNLFPSRAKEADWFRSHHVIEAMIEDRIRAQRELKLKEQQRARRLSEESATTALTESESSSSHSGSDSPIVVRRSTIDIASMSMADGNSLSLPLAFTSITSQDDEAVDVNGIPVRSTSTRRSSVDSAPEAQLSSLLIKEIDDPNKNKKRKESAEEYAPVPSIHERDINYGAILGTGGFCEVRLASLKLDGVAKSKNGKRYAMKYLSPTKLLPKEYDTSKKNSNGTYSKTKVARNKRFERGIADLSIEARFLTILSHENIIDLHYVSKGMLSEQYNCEGESNYYHQFGYFLMLDPLFESLNSRIDGTYIPEVFDCGVGAGMEVSRRRSSSSSSSWWNRMAQKNSANDNLTLDTWRLQLAKRLTALKSIASALQYLHDDCHVVYRDIKPDNIGFYRKPHANCTCGLRSSQRHHSPTKQDCTCYDEIPKLFDLGLCKELKADILKVHPNHDPYDPKEEKTYKLTGRSGSRRYMSPEVAFSQPYNEKADVYSFGIMLYQVASLITPFDGYSMYQHEEAVLLCGYRPNVKISSSSKALRKGRKTKYASHERWLQATSDDRKEKHLSLRTKCVWNKELTQLIESCWDGDMRLRPSMKDVGERLNSCVLELMNKTT